MSELPGFAQSTRDWGPKTSDLPLFARPQSPHERRDADAVAAWPYPLPAFEQLLPDMVTRYMLGLNVDQDPVRAEARWLSIMCCPPGITPETHNQIAMTKAGVLGI